MAVRKVIKIDEDLCDGCGECVPTCHEGAIQIIEGKARLVGDNLCDGLGDCLGNCPLGAITIEEREADSFDDEAVKKHLSALGKEESEVVTAPAPATREQIPLACPGSRTMSFGAPCETQAPAGDASPASTLRQWPVQLHLLSPIAPYFRDADLLLASDCSAFALGDFHARHLQGKALAIACPKLDQGLDIYHDKLVAMIEQGGINSITALVMEVPCCTGLARLAVEATRAADRKVPVKRVMVGVKGDILDEQWL